MPQIHCIISVLREEKNATKYFNLYFFLIKNMKKKTEKVVKLGEKH